MRNYIILFPDLLLGIGLLDDRADIVREQSEKRPSLLHRLLLPQGANTCERNLVKLPFKGKRYRHDLPRQTKEIGIVSEEVTRRISMSRTFKRRRITMSCSFVGFLLTFLFADFQQCPHQSSGHTTTSALFASERWQGPEKPGQHLSPR